MAHESVDWYLLSARNRDEHDFIEIISWIGTGFISYGMFAHGQSGAARRASRSERLLPWAQSSSCR